MRKHLFIAFILLGCTLKSNAQGYSNDWIDYSPNRLYLKFPIAQSGIYHLDFTTLDFAFQLVGSSISSVDPRSVQVFARGQEQFIHVEGQSDGTFDSGDFIEFYAEKNDGWLDEQLYPSAAEHTNPYFSLYNDTIYYYLTWDPSGSPSSFRYEEVAFGVPPSTPVDYLLQEARVVFTNEYNIGQTVTPSSDKPITQYIGGKGWTSGRSGFNGSSVLAAIAFNPQITNLYSAGNAPESILNFAITSANRGALGTEAHHIKLIRKLGNAETVIQDYIKPEFFFSKETVSLAPSDLSNGVQFLFRSELNGSLVNATADYFKVAYATLLYPKLPIFGGASESNFQIPNSPIDLFLNATGFSTSPVSHLYDLGLHKRIAVDHSTSTGSLKAPIEAGSKRSFFVASQSAIKSISSQTIQAIGSDGRFTNLALSLDSAYLFITHKSLMSAVQSYKSYRDQDYTTVIINIEDLYEQFGFGIKRHPLAIRNFATYAVSEWPSKPRFLFLVGKSVAEAEFRRSATIANQVLVPTMGYPPNDNLLTAGIGQSQDYVMGIPTGRIAAQTPAQVNTYRQKIIAQENTQSAISGSYTIDNKLWQKRILHFAGGDNSSENRTFENYLAGYASYVEDSLIAAKRLLFSKTSSSTIEQLDVDTVRQLLKDGVALMTFFGHGGGNTFDISVDNPADWGNENQGRYPFVIANSCFSGNIHRPAISPSISEEYVFTPNEGAIAFMATPDLSLQGQLNEYTNNFYKHLSRDNYGKSAGEQMQAAAKDMGNSILSSGVALEMTLHGDPALKIFPHQRPEITINDPIYGAAVRFEPEIVTSDLDSFDVIIILTNLGRSVTKPFSISASRYFNCGSNSPDDIKYAQLDFLNYQAEVRITFPVLKNTDIGENCFSIDVDLPISNIPEFNDFGNNQISKEKLTISSTDIFPVFPYDFAVIEDFDVSLKANTGLPFLAENSYLIEIDTTDLYNSSWKKDTTITQSGAVISWDPKLERYGFKDSTVFFWRVTPNDDLSKFREHSFQVIDSKTGWGQDHFFQFKENSFDFLNYSRSNRTFSFDSVSRDLFVFCLANPPLSNNAYLSNNRYTLDGQGAPFGEYGVAPGGAPSILISVIDTANLAPWGTRGLENGLVVNQDKNFGNTNDHQSLGDGRNRVQYWFSFNATTAGLDNAVNMIENEVPNGFYILMYTSIKGLFQDTTRWKNSHFEAFEALGADSIRFVENNNPYILIAKKGKPNEAIEVVGKNSTDDIQLNTKLKSNLSLGSINGPAAGPAMAWETLLFKHKSSASNSATVKVLNGNIEVYPPTMAYDNDISSVDADEYNSLSLSFFTDDDQSLTPSQLNNWHLLYEPVPEAAVNPFRGQLFPTQELNVGEEALFGVSIENVSEYDFKELRIKYWLISKSNELIEEQWITLDSFSAGSFRMDTISFKTDKLSGDYTIWMEVNPEDSLWQKEQFHFNNTAFKSLTVIADNKNPLLDVTFDGVHILNGDIVSPSPEIVMQIKDENKLLLVDDTNAFEVFITDPNAIQRRVPFVSNGVQVMEFEPATTSQNKARLRWSPKDLADGTYTLSAMGKDASGNTSGNDAYKIEFEVINESSITNVMNYPNPFTSSTRFVFTLTGSQIPDVFTIQIMTVTGKVVREITKDELGNIRIGRNITDYAWNGRDEYGDRLANGVYLYRVITKINGEKIENRSTEADQFFKQEFGKMYLFR